MTSPNPFFIGYDSLEEWERQARGATAPGEHHKKTIYLMPVETITASGNFSNHELAVIATHLDPYQRQAHFIRLVVANLTYVQSEYLGLETDQRRARENLDQVYTLVHDWLSHKGYRLLRAAVAFPTALHLIDGWADFLAYDKAQRIFVNQAA